MNDISPRDAVSGTVLAITDAMIRRDGQAADRVAAIAPTAALIQETLNAMPDHLRLPMRILTWLFGISSRLAGGRPFHALPLERRIGQIARWEASRLGFRRSLIAFYRTFATYGVYSRLYGADLEAGGGDAR